MTALELQERLRAVDPRVLVVAERHLNRLLRRRQDRGIPTVLAVDIPHRFHRDELLADDQIAERISSEQIFEYFVVVDPHDLVIGQAPEPEMLRFYWRMLFAEAIERAVRNLNAAPVPQLLHEARHLLETDHRIPPGAGDESVWHRFLALAMNRARFEPASLPGFFPFAPTPEAIRALLPSDIPVEDILASSRPAGAADVLRPDQSESQPPAAPRRESVAHRLAQAEAAIRTGNYVRAAIRFEQSGDRNRALQQLDADLLPKLGPLFGWDADRTKAWRQALASVLSRAAQGHWPHAARLLFDLQTLAHDLSGELYNVDLPGAILSLGRKPVRRKMTHARDVLIHQKLLSVERHLDKSHLTHDEEAAVAVLLSHERKLVEDRLRRTLGPVIEAQLTDAGIIPLNRAETISRDAVVAELLDATLDRGFIRFADFRDSIARNHLKLPDLTGPFMWLWSDPLLTADRRLAEHLDGIYRRGEIYLRWFHRFSSPFFGTWFGRLLTLYLILPFLGSFLTLEFAQHVWHGAQGTYRFFSKILAPKVPAPAEAIAPAPTDPEPEPDPDVWDDGPINIDVGEGARVLKEVVTSTAGSGEHGTTFVTLPAVIALGVIFLVLIASPTARRWFWQGFRTIGRGIRYVCYDAPLSVWNAQAFRDFRNHPVSVILYRRLGTATAFTILAIGLTLFLGGSWYLTGRNALYTFVVVGLFANTRFGRRLEDGTAEAMWDTFRLIRINLIPGLIAWFADVFRALVGLVERMLYGVEEWFRYREGQSQSNVTVKAIFSLIWFPLAYIVRFGFYLLLEPQVNPIKHFPVVTVSHKVLFTTIPWICSTFHISEATAISIIWLIPGIFGFLAWEYKENWRLYRSNRPRTLRPRAVGHHGESVRGLLRPGFHSGTIPKLFRKTRIALRHAERRRIECDLHRFHHELHHLETALTRFIDRHVLAALRSHAAWRARPLAVHHVAIWCQSIIVELEVGLPKPLPITLTHRDQTIYGSVNERMLAELPPPQREPLQVALAGMFDYAAAQHGPAEAPRPPMSWSNWVAAWNGSDSPRPT